MVYIFCVISKNLENFSLTKIFLKFLAYQNFFKNSSKWKTLKLFGKFKNLEYFSGLEILKPRKCFESHKIFATLVREYKTGF